MEIEELQANPVRERTGKPVAGGEERNREDDSNPEVCKETISHEFSFRQKEHTHRITWLINQDHRSGSFNLTKFPTLSTFSCWKIRFKTQISACSSFHPEAMSWIKEVEMVDLVDDFLNHRAQSRVTLISRILRCWMRGLPLLLNKIIQNSRFKKTVSLEDQKAQKEDRFFRGRQIAYLIYDYFRVTDAHDTVVDYADLFSITLRNDDFQECDTRWYAILLSMTKIPPDVVLESLYKLRIRES